jgi:hypothetical protein
MRCLELIASVGLLVFMILIKGTDATTGWIMRIVPGVAILHTIYAISHLVRNSNGKTPGSSLSYMLFASFFDVTITPFYAFSALVARTRHAGWTSILSNPDIMNLLPNVIFYTAAVGGGLFLISLILSISLAVIFRKITMLPPDMNPLEDNLTSRHKRNKPSEISNSTTTEKRTSLPLESKRSSGAAYEDLSRPPTIPFFHTRSGSTESFSTYKSTPPPTRDSRLDLPSRQYQIGAESNRSSITDLKRASFYDASPPKRTSYNSIPVSDVGSYRDSIIDMKHASFYNSPATPPKNASYTEISLSETSSQRHSRSNGRANKVDTWYTRDSLPKRHSVASTRDSLNSASSKKGYQPVHQRHDSEDLAAFNLPNPLEANPPTSRHSYKPSRDSPLAEISNNRASSDIADSSHIRDHSPTDLLRRNSKHYGELRPGTPPIMIGGKSRQVSSGTDFVVKGGYKPDRRDVSGKVAEEGRSGGWGTRFRKVSGI